MSDTENEGGPVEAEEAAAPVMVVMVRDEPQVPGGPVEADVPPSETASYIAAGWVLAEGQELPELPAGEPKTLEDMGIEELRAIAAEEGVSFTPRSGEERLRADIAGARAKAMTHG